MANTKKTTTKAAKVETVSAEAPQVVNVKRVFDDDTQIMCRSLTQGGLYMQGARTKEIYEWPAYGEEIPVKYVDLATAVRTRSVFVFNPYFIIEDEDFINEFPQLVKFYNERFTVKDLRDILDLDVSEMVATIEVLPDGAKESLKAVASQAVKDGAIDSVRKIKALDELFGTDFNLLADLFQQ